MITSRGSTGVSDHKLSPSPAKAQMGSPKKKVLQSKAGSVKKRRLFQNISKYWGLYNWGDPQSGWFIMENPIIKVDDLWVPP